MKETKKTKTGRKLNKGRKIMAKLVRDLGPVQALKIGYEKGVCQRNLILGAKLSKIRERHKMTCITLDEIASNEVSLALMQIIMKQASQNEDCEDG